MGEQRGDAKLIAEVLPRLYDVPRHVVAVNELVSERLLVAPPGVEQAAEHGREPVAHPRLAFVLDHPPGDETLVPACERNHRQHLALGLGDQRDMQQLVRRCRALARADVAHCDRWLGLNVVDE
eukprot:3414919-Pyramimonas_sp.AAC.1